ELADGVHRAGSRDVEHDCRRVADRAEGQHSCKRDDRSDDALHSLLPSHDVARLLATSRLVIRSVPRVSSLRVGAGRHCRWDATRNGLLKPMPISARVVSEIAQMQGDLAGDTYGDVSDPACSRPSTWRVRKRAGGCDMTCAKTREKW